MSSLDEWMDLIEQNGYDPLHSGRPMMTVEEDDTTRLDRWEVFLANGGSMDWLCPRSCIGVVRKDWDVERLDGDYGERRCSRAAREVKRRAP